jgi:dTDP-4-amino-4,6-dideoxygalactose transaminase
VRFGFTTTGMIHLPFNKPFVTGRETDYLDEAVREGKISGNGTYTKKSQQLLAELTGARKVLLTTSCTDALEMAAILLDIQPGDEVIMPSYTFVSTANAFILRGAKIVFVDSKEEHPGMDEKAVEALVNERTRAIVAVHYAGVACDMKALKNLSARYNIHLVEDAAQAIDSHFTWPDGTTNSLGTIGAFGTYSFHETKNIQCGEGGALLINESKFENRAEIIWEKGTNRAAFWRGEVDKYGWVDIGSSFLPSELSAAFLFAQLEDLSFIQKRRREIWNRYNNGLKPLVDVGIRLPYIPNYATNNAHMFYLVCRNLEERTGLIQHLKKQEIHSVFHYISLHSSAYFQNQYDGRDLPWTKRYSDCLVRLPLHMYLSDNDVERVVSAVTSFYSEMRS